MMAYKRSKVRLEDFEQVRSELLRNELMEAWNARLCDVDVLVDGVLRLQGELDAAVELNDHKADLLENYHQRVGQLWMEGLLTDQAACAILNLDLKQLCDEFLPPLLGSEKA